VVSAIDLVVCAIINIILATLKNVDDDDDIAFFTFKYRGALKRQTTAVYGLMAAGQSP